MGDVVFAQTRTKYDSYTDYWKLVDLADFNTCYIDEIDFEKDIKYIVTPINGEFRPHIDNEKKKKKNKKAEIIWWNLERGKAPDMDIYADRIWSSDRHFAKKNYQEFVPFGTDKRLKPPDTNSYKQKYDFIHLSYLSYRRDHIVGALSTVLQVAPNSWGEERHKNLLSTRFMLNIHQDERKDLEPLRFALCAAYGLPMLSEECHDPYPYFDATYVSYHNLYVAATTFNDTKPLKTTSSFRDEVIEAL